MYQVRVSVSGIDEDIVDPDDPFFTPGLPSSSGDMGEGVHGSPHSHSGHHPLHHHQPQPDVVQSPDLETKVKVCVTMDVHGGLGGGVG